MYKTLLVISLTVASILSSCGFIIITTAKWEKPIEFLVAPNVTPSQLIYQFTQDTMAQHKNYVVVFYAPECSYCLAQMPNLNLLHQQYGDRYHFIAVTYRTVEEVEKHYKRADIPADQVYHFKNYYDIWGLRSSMRNLYYQNDLTKLPGDGDPVNVIVKKDSIVYVSEGSVFMEETLARYKTMLD